MTRYVRKTLNARGADTVWLQNLSARLKNPTTVRMKARIALLLFASIAQCLAADPLSTLAELRAALREELKSALDKGNIENNQRLYQLESLLVESLPDKELPDEKMA